MIVVRRILCGIPDIAVERVHIGFDHDDDKYLLILKVTNGEHLESVCLRYASTSGVARERMAVACARGECIEEMVI